MTYLTFHTHTLILTNFDPFFTIMNLYKIFMICNICSMYSCGILPAYITHIGRYISSNARFSSKLSFFVFSSLCGSTWNFKIMKNDSDQHAQLLRLWNRSLHHGYLRKSRLSPPPWGTDVGPLSKRHAFTMRFYNMVRRMALVLFYILTFFIGSYMYLVVTFTMYIHVNDTFLNI